MTKKLSVFVDPTGKIRTIEPTMAELLHLRTSGRFSYIEPANKYLRYAYRTIRNRVADDSRTAAWTRMWPVLWQVRIAKTGQILGTYWTREAAIRGEKDFFSTGRWLPGHLDDHPQGVGLDGRKGVQDTY